MSQTISRMNKKCMLIAPRTYRRHIFHFYGAVISFLYSGEFFFFFLFQLAAKSKTFATPKHQKCSGGAVNSLAFAPAHTRPSPLNGRIHLFALFALHVLPHHCDPRHHAATWRRFALMLNCKHSPHEQKREKVKFTQSGRRVGKKYEKISCSRANLGAKC